MDVFQAINERRSIRKYRTDPIPDEYLQTILEAARRAPSWHNTQCWRLVIVRDPDTKKLLSEALKGGPSEANNPASDAIQRAPVVIVACALKGRSGYLRKGEMGGIPATDKGEWWFMFDVALAMQNVSLAAHALGLGTVHIGLFDSSKVADILGIPDNVAVVEMMPMGWPDEKPQPRRRKEISQF
ncbi:MAG: nitroreductase family protein, partial [Dehalococcoidia bacterium]|nr:nitroreductase family protein [Dehalococcoidia bacterium]